MIGRRILTLELDVLDAAARLLPATGVFDRRHISDNAPVKLRLGPLPQTRRIPRWVCERLDIGERVRRQLEAEGDIGGLPLARLPYQG